MPTPRPLTSEEKELHFRFLRFEIPWAELFRDRHGVLEFNFTLNAGNFVANFLTPDPGVPVTLSDIDFAIAKYKIGEISKDGLASWATLLLLNDAFDWQDPDEDEVARRMNDLSMPQLFRKG